MGFAKWPVVVLLTVGLLAAVAFAGMAFYTEDPEMPNPAVSDRAGDVLLVNAFAEEPTGEVAPPGSNLELYGWLFNDGEDEIVLTSISAPVARQTSPVKGELPITLPPQKWTAFEPEGNYLVLRDLLRPVVAGEELEVTFEFAGNPPLTTRVLARTQPSKGELPELPTTEGMTTDATTVIASANISTGPYAREP